MAGTRSVTITRIFVLVLIAETYVPRVRAQCTINLLKEHYSTSSPLILDKNSFDTVYPARTSIGFLTFQPGQDNLLFYCPGGQVTNENALTGFNSQLVKCVDKLTFSIQSNNAEVTFDQFGCSSSPTLVTKESTRTNCQNGVVVNIGFQVTQAVFKKTIDLCYVGESATTAWSHSRIPSFIAGIKVNDKKPNGTPTFSKGSAYFNKVFITTVYPVDQQMSTFLRIFNNNTNLVNKYLRKDGEKKNYLVKGHLVARADMFYPSEQHSTYMYINVVPMWLSINNGNWKSVEYTLRRIAEIEGDLDVWTGGIGVLELESKFIYLADNNKVPVPKLLYKLVYNQPRNEALAFISANDPYLVNVNTSFCPEYQQCNLSFKQFKNTYAGYTYCCLYQDFVNSLQALGIDVPLQMTQIPAPLTLR